ncbi:hypothetical protein DICVIV_12599 [Dictyocaulus viviparus]|uniref:Uncharacterized protein n=1 Tax=Dictyocaulus viviparus TaxID=29172 RepID=A0A0D8XCP7_DICVI|nr:hypothetical protein DICVIV_12599 [Dictyocaulus viviparus]
MCFKELLLLVHFFICDNVIFQIPLRNFHSALELDTGLSEKDTTCRQEIYGRNIIDVKIKPILVLLFMEVISPFYIFQVFRSQEKKLRSMVKSSSELVPGDIFFIPTNGVVMQCDALLMTGTAIVNESMLTGESVPITKVVPH